jgi:hypothetical protein
MAKLYFLYLGTFGKIYGMITVFEPEKTIISGIYSVWIIYVLKTEPHISVHVMTCSGIFCSVELRISMLFFSVSVENSFIHFKSHQN